MHFTILSLFPDMFPGTLGFSLAGQALQENLWSYNAVDIRKYGIGKNSQVDDYIYGGGSGMVIRPDVLGAAIEESVDSHQKIYYMSPRGIPIHNEIIDDILSLESICIICGRYEGIDQRVIDEYNIQEVCVGDVVLSGGEPAALLLMDAIIRKIPGVINNNIALREESFGGMLGYKSLLEYDLYTKPAKWKGRSVPSVLTTGNHNNIKIWKAKRSLDLTKARRPDILSD